VPWVLHDLALGGDENHLHAHVNAGLASGERERVQGDVRAGAADVPAVRLTRDADGLDDALDPTQPPQATRPIFDSTREPFSRRAPLLYSLKVKDLYVKEW
jgi:hypothetical protein